MVFSLKPQRNTVILHQPKTLSWREKALQTTCLSVGQSAIGWRTDQLLKSRMKKNGEQSRKIDNPNTKKYQKMDCSFIYFFLKASPALAGASLKSYATKQILKDAIFINRIDSCNIYYLFAIDLSKPHSCIFQFFLAVLRFLTIRFIHSRNTNQPTIPLNRLVTFRPE